MLHNLYMTAGTERAIRYLLAGMLKMLAWLVVVLVCAQAAQAAALVLDADTGANRVDPAIEFLFDATGQLNLAQIETQSDLQFAPISRSKPYLLGNGTLWMRFDAVINNPAPHWRLTIPMPSLDDVTLYYRDAAGQWVTQQAGDNRPMSTWAQRGRYPVFSLSYELGQSVRYYVQIRHTRVPYSILPRIVSDTRFISSRQNEHMLLGIYFGLAALVLTLALANALSYRDWGFGSYVAYVGLFAAAQAGTVGVAALYWWPEWPVLNNAATISLTALAAAAGLWFVRTVTMPRRFSRALDVTMLVLMGLLPLVGLLNATLPDFASYTVYNLLVSASVLVLLVAVAAALVDGDRHARWVALGFLPVLLTAVLPLLRNVGLVSSGFLTDYGLMLGSAIEAPILFYGLHRRVSQHRNLTTRASALRNTDPLTGLHSTRVLVSRLRQLLGAAQRNPQAVALLLIDLTNLAQLKKQHGRESADRAMVTAAVRIRRVAQAKDTVARVGDGQFALLMEDATSAQATDVATKILARGLRPAGALPGAEPLIFHIGVGLLGEATGAIPADADACLARMLQAVKSMNDGSGKAIRLLQL